MENREKPKGLVDIPTVNDAGLFVTPATYAHYLGIAHATVCRQCRQGKIRAVQCGKQWRIPLSWILAQCGEVE